MTRHKLETAVAAATLLGVAAALAVPVSVETVRRRGSAPSNRTLTLTAVAAQGTWTEDVVNAGNAWRRDFRPARPVLRVGETVRLRLQSADVVHTFSVPELGIDPIDVYPGKVVTLTITPARAGTFEYYCTTVCGERHFAMRGLLDVIGATESPSPKRTVEPPGRAYWRSPLPDGGASPWERGAALYERTGCVTCHGPEGRGGVRNPNSMNPTVPALANLARRLFLFAPTDVAAFRGVVGGRKPLEGLQEKAEIPLFSLVREQYLATRRLVGEGRRSARLDPSGPRPPLDMPAWGARLGHADIDAILTYLLDPDAGAGRTARPGPVLPDPKGEAR